MKKHGYLWWLCIGWWWLPLKWMCYNIPAFIIRNVLNDQPSQENTATQTHTTPTPSNISTPTSPSPEPTPTDLPQQTPQQTPQGNVKTYKATGMSYRLENLLSISSENEDYNRTKKDLISDGLTDERVYKLDFYAAKVELVPEPDNPHDPNAIKVVVDGVHIAYIKAGSCKHLLKMIRENRIEKIRCSIEGGKYKYIATNYNEDGDETYTMDKGDAPYSVTLYVTEL